MQDTIRLAYCPTRRDVFSREEAIKFNSLIRAELEKLPAKIIDLSGINEEKLLYSDTDIAPAIAKFTAAGVDALFVPPSKNASRKALFSFAQNERIFGGRVLRNPRGQGVFG